jgi:hypothetical protein
MNNYPAQQRSAIRQDCRTLRKRVLSTRQLSILPLLLDIGNIECSVLIAEPDEFPVIRENLTRLTDRLKSAGEE